MSKHSIADWGWQCNVLAPTLHACYHATVAAKRRLPVQPYPMAFGFGMDLRAIRVARGARQDDVARAARKAGLPWTRASVASLETGRRAMTVDELRLLPVLLHHLGAPADIRITATVEHTDFRIGSREPMRVNSPIRWQPSLSELRERAHVLKGWPDVSEQDVRAATPALGGSAEHAIARRLKATPLDIVLAARRLWSRSLSEERDRRLSATGDASPESVRTARGHITRELVGAIAPLVLEARRRRGPIRE